MKKILILITSIILFGSVVSCKKEKDPSPSDPVNPNESELITTLMLIITDPSMDKDTVYFRDLDGEGGNAPTIETINLINGTSYSCEVVLLDETKNPADTISEEVAEEADVHQFFYSVSNGLPLSASYASGDVDVNGVPLGLFPQLETAGTGSGSLTIILKHQGDDKPDSGQGDAALGDTDIEVTFPVSIN